MKKLMFATLLLSGLVMGTSVNAQNAEDKSKRPSPPATVTQKITNGATITIDYSQPSVKGRTIGKDLEPMDGQVWRTGANEATVFQTDKALTINGKTLPAGKYGLFTIFNGMDDASVIFSKTWKQWGAFKYNQAEDALRVNADVDRLSPASEIMTFKVSPSGEVALLWGDRKMEFDVK